MSAAESLPVLAKSSCRKITLADHTRRVVAEAARIIAARPFVCYKYREQAGNKLGALVEQSAYWHDAGKKHPKWQTACRKDYRASLLSGRNEGGSIRRAGIRHEIVSLDYMRRAGINAPLAVRAAVAAHHSKLSHRQEHRWKDDDEPTFEIFWKEFLRESNQLRTSLREDFERAIEWRYRVAGVRGLLQLADHRSSAAEEDEPLPPLETFAYKFPHAEKRGVQKEIEKLWDEPFAILRAPTGAGKTDAALLWAQHQIECGRADRLVIAMPTRFTANALAINTAKTLSATGLYHSSALYQRQNDAAANAIDDAPRFACNRGIFTEEEVSRFIDKEQELARKLETAVTVTTIDHLCLALTGTREDHHAIFFSLAHSCLVIDEADFYDDFTQQNIVTLLRALRVLNVPVLLMSATVPESARELYARSGMKAAKIYEDRIDYERSRCLLRRHGIASTPDDYSDLLQRPLKGEPTVIYINTVRRAQELYLWFKRQIEDDESGDVKLKLEDVTLYHSRFTEPHKVEKEAQLLALLGQKAWREGAARGVAILTQIGEISVNISADLMISELCPIDRLAQRAGRLARFRERADGRHNVKGELFVVEPQRLNKKKGEIEFYPAPYGHFTSANGWEMSEPLRDSIRLLANGDYSAKTFVDLTDQLYPSAKEPLSHVRDNVRAFENCVVSNWLILPCEQVENEDDETKDWRSRDIPFQATVYADVHQSNFDFEATNELPTTRSERRRFELRHGIKCYAHEFNAAVSNKFLRPTTIRLHEREPETLWLVPERCYSKELGLRFDGTASAEFEE